MEPDLQAHACIDGHAARMHDRLRPRVASGTLEALKWLAFAGMVVDHVNTGFFRGGLPAWADAVGRPVFPVFAAVFAYNLARPNVDAEALWRRLLLPGLVAIPAFSYLLLDGPVPLPLNILLLFAICAACVQLHARGQGVWAAMLAVMGGTFVEYHHVGIALVLAGVFVLKRPGVWSVLAYAAAFAALCVFNGNGWALLALPLLAAATGITLRVPRSGALLRWFYPAHLYVLAGILLVVPRASV